jgi:hypothetical protein
VLKPEYPPEMLKFSETHHMFEICRPVYKQIPPDNSWIEIEGKGLTWSQFVMDLIKYLYGRFFSW